MTNFARALLLLFSMVSQTRAEGPPVSGRPLAVLPAGLNPLPGTTGLYVAHAGWLSDETGIYLVNRSAGTLNLRFQGADPYLKLEHEYAPGRWERAQSHRNYCCGNGYWSGPALNPGEFLQLRGFRPKSGRPARLRYTLYSQGFSLSSLPFDGVVDDEELVKAQHDEMALEAATTEVARDVALGIYRAADPTETLALRTVAVSRLGALASDDPRARVVLETLAAVPMPEEKEGSFGPTRQAAWILKWLDGLDPQRSPN